MRQPAHSPDRTLFISYRVSDTGPTASRLFKELAEAYGAERVFIDHERLEGGAVWPERLEAEARRASVMLVLIGKGWLRVYKSGVRRLDPEGDWVRKEIEAALGAGALVMPLLVEGARPLFRQVLLELVPSLEPLADRQALTLRRIDWASDLERLHELLEANGFLRRRTSAAKHPHQPLRVALVLVFLLVAALTCTFVLNLFVFKSSAPAENLSTTFGLTYAAFAGIYGFLFMSFRSLMYLIPAFALCLLGGWLFLVPPGLPTLPTCARSSTSHPQSPLLSTR